MRKLPPASFLKGVTKLDDLPEADRPEVAFWGRSNVGKSSLLNAVTGKQGLARTSNTPGRTQEINFFDMGDQFYLVDLPGYGYAEAPKSKVKAWTNLTKKYLAERPNLRRVYVLIDARHGIKDIDHEIFKLLDAAAVSYQLVLTKADKIKTSLHQETLDKVLKDCAPYAACHPVILLTSSEKGLGLDAFTPEMLSAVGIS